MKKVVLVTGASSGLGKAASKAYLADGWNVIMIARNLDSLKRAQDELDPTHESSLVITADISIHAQVREAVALAKAKFGRIDVLINNAAIDVPATLDDLSVENWDSIISTNVNGAFYFAKELFPLLKAQGGGWIINISSIAGKRGWARASAYCASKFALTGFTQALQCEGRPYNIRCCIVYPGGIDTRWHTPPHPSDMNPDAAAQVLLQIANQPENIVINELVLNPLQEAGYP